MRGRVLIPLALLVCAACGGGGSNGDDETSPVGDHLSVVPAPGTDSKCDGSFTPGQSVVITDPRFAPSASVTLTITPPTGAPITSTMFASIDGSISKTIQLPQTTGTMYVAATGVSAFGTQTNDTVGIDILAPGSKCE